VQRRIDLGAAAIDNVTASIDPHPSQAPDQDLAKTLVISSSRDGYHAGPWMLNPQQNYGVSA
jgi:hypothetical protein